MKLYIALSILSSAYITGLTLGKIQDIQFITWNAVIGAMMPLALVMSVVPLAGPLLYDVALQVLTSALNPPLQIETYLRVLKAASWAINVLFTVSLILYIAQYKRYLARRIIRFLLL